ncbi:JAB1/Mov34/MPN/PAD-1 ubiquitin protease-domain-containing protein [Annulohypoxylon maeteangense]|uniref:JAB1/Mov34/MPN/PAD-1 ubiquitin protease-domain-containing protein n=1 Tax=Annulohypoxylon maeteangense TaxID=1927788 RepID=UPI002008B58C|nr:JAB1/Mov34/MPN/PAD-1 ubiquitin protease-domain-containing protein [Annulohypoxylon maeteangense]KAI0883462.1 JAB1/Mov34/MPN/PAD-1 ubiquitin protease-domain-containing protein [Annulohypoxylon maeteangense]
MEVAMKSWELDNDIKLVDPTRDALYNFDNDRQTEINASKPWKENPHHFQHVRISAVALIKMVMHARSGGSIEIMGIMQGYTDGDTIVVTDAFGLPVEGTETRVNAQDDALEYMVSYLSLCRAQGSRQENPVGWYHSHPGYGCWLSGIDVGTQSMQQQFNDPFVAVVIDPDRTISAGRVEIGAFRTFPDDYKPASPTASSSGGSAAVPLAKAEDFGAHASKYYSLEVSHFKSTLDSSLLDLLWSKYWVQTLSQNPLLTNRDYGNKTLLDLGSKIRDTTTSYQRAARGGGGGPINAVGKSAIDQEIEKLARTSHLVTMNEKQGLMAVEVKAKIFNGLGAGGAGATTTTTT